MPVLLLLVLLPMQFALWWHAKQAADLAAEEGVEAAQVVGADPVADGTAGVYAVLSEAGNLTNVTVTVTPNAETVVVEVRGELNYSVIGTYTVTARAEGPLEQFIPADQR
jgi:hypothetical protein